MICCGARKRSPTFSASARPHLLPDPSEASADREARSQDRGREPQEAAARHHRHPHRRLTRAAAPRRCRRPRCAETRTAATHRSSVPQPILITDDAGALGLVLPFAWAAQTAGGMSVYAMTVAEILSKHGIKLGSIAPGRHYTTCPHCSSTRSSSEHRAAKVLGVTIDNARCALGLQSLRLDRPGEGQRRSQQRQGKERSPRLRLP